ncbi:hypothetical protein Tco_0921372 [Tanacetum coccineum]
MLQSRCVITENLLESVYSVLAKVLRVVRIRSRKSFYVIDVSSLGHGVSRGWLYFIWAKTVVIWGESRIASLEFLSGCVVC